MADRVSHASISVDTNQLLDQTLSVTFQDFYQILLR